MTDLKHRNITLYDPKIIDDLTKGIKWRFANISEELTKIKSLST
jgi:hypothetical protein